jgi:IS30 family transposase
MDKNLTPEWLSRREVAQSEGVCTMTIAREVKRGRFPPGVRFPNGRLFWHVSTIEEHRRKRRAYFGIGVPVQAQTCA